MDTVNNSMLSVALTQMNVSFLHSNTGRGSLRENSLYITAAHHEVYGLFFESPGRELWKLLLFNARKK